MFSYITNASQVFSKHFIHTCMIMPSQVFYIFKGLIIFCNPWFLFTLSMSFITSMTNQTLDNKDSNAHLRNSQMHYKYFKRISIHTCMILSIQVFYILRKFSIICNQQFHFKLSLSSITSLINQTLENKELNVHFRISQPLHRFF